MRIVLAAMLLLLPLLSCGDEGAPEPVEPAAGETSQEETGGVEAEPAASEESTPADEKPVTRRKETPTARMAYIVLAHAESRLGDLQPRSREETLRLAKKLLQELRDGGDVKALAAELSDDPDRATNLGEMLVLNSGSEEVAGTPRARLPEVAERLFQLEQGAVAMVVPEDPSRSLGIWLIKRLD